ncbi:50S ribosomal protein L23 [Buchnera aphidicola (Formosaphis micheliae)]|uniref:50S ribosomal protein L23 n=1 Tax=Buchnera aphidicola TaxID=9 RepID=UPI0031B83B37
MINQDYLFDILLAPKVSEKSSFCLKESNTIIFKVKRDTNKLIIKHAIQNLLKVEVLSINTLLVKGKKKIKNHKVIKKNNWKKAYITLKKGHNLDSISNIDSV